MEHEQDRVVDVDGRQYRLRPWVTKDGQIWAFRLTKIAMAVAGAIGSEHAAVASLLERVTDEQFGAFRDACLRYTDLLERDTDGAELVVDLAKSPGRLEGKYLDLYAIMEGHITHEFGPFFDGLRRRNAEAVQKVAATRPAAG